jgi:hypothetical protein
VLSYGDSKLLERDVQLLKGPHWLNDQVAHCGESYSVAHTL